MHFRVYLVLMTSGIQAMEMLMLAPYSNYIQRCGLMRFQTVGAAMSRTAPTDIPLLSCSYSEIVLLLFCSILLHVPMLFCCDSLIILCILIRTCSMCCCYPADGFFVIKCMSVALSPELPGFRVPDSESPISSGNVFFLDMSSIQWLLAK